MHFTNSKLAGTLLLVAAIQFTMLSTVAEAIYPNYNISTNYISDLGVWGTPSAIIFNPSIILSGILTLASTYFIHRHFCRRSITTLFTIAGAGVLGVGFFPENTFLVSDVPVIHTIAAFMVFAGGALAAIAVYRVVKSPFRYISVFLGLISITSLFLLILTSGSNWLGLGGGGMERMVAYPTMLSQIAFGGYLLNAAKK